MDATGALAVWGAALSTALAALKGLEFWRDRPRLEVGLNFGMNLAVPHPLIRITVTNHGLQPVTIMEAGLVTESTYSVQGKGGESVPGQRKIPMDSGELRLIEPGGVTRYEVVFTELPPMLHVDDPLRAYVRASNKKVAWGGSSPLFRRMIEHGWKPVRESDPRLLERWPEPVVSKPVYPGWQVWKPKGLRGRLFHRDELTRLS